VPAPTRRLLLLWLLALACASSFLQAAVLFVPAIVFEVWPNDHTFLLVWSLAGVFLWGAAVMGVEWEMVLGFGRTDRVWVRALAVVGLTLEAAAAFLSFPSLGNYSRDSVQEISTLCSS
jgi:hypothetical protein